MHCFMCGFAAAPANGGFPPEPVLHAATEYRWVHPAELDRYTLPAGHRKLLDAWLPDLVNAAGK